jgi:hypothetical protein
MTVMFSFPETSVNFYQTTRRHIPNDCKFYSRRHADRNLANVPQFGTIIHENRKGTEKGHWHEMIHIYSSRHFPYLSHWTPTMAATLRHLTVETNNGLRIILFKDSIQPLMFDDTSAAGKVWRT